MTRRVAFRFRTPRAFTLVELLVVITVIGILMGMLLPAVSAINESARNSRCKNNLRQIGLAMRAHCEKRGVFPTGGVGPWPQIDDYLTKEKIPFGPDRQGLGWAFQLLPYMEMETAFNIAQLPERELTGGTYQSALQKVVLPFYFCPSRRKPTLRENGEGSPNFGGAMLNDYAAATPARFTSLKTYEYQPNNPDDLERNQDSSSSSSSSSNSSSSSRPGSMGYGVIVRTQSKTSAGQKKGSPPTTLAMIHDGLGFTLMVGEKRVEKDHYFSGEATYDDRGWSDGWSPNIIRSTGFVPAQDIIAEENDDRQRIGFAFGAAHTGFFNVVFADGRVASLSYNINATLFNALGDRDDAYRIDETQL